MSERQTESGPARGTGTDRESKLHLIAILVITIGIMVDGVLVVRFPQLAGPSVATPATGVVATPAAPGQNDEAAPSS